MKPNEIEIKKLDWIDAGRGFAILFVIICHAGGEFVNDTFFHYHFTHYGMFGVQLFFVMSSYTLMYSYVSRKNNFSIKDFYIRRFFRIAPLYYIMLLVYCLITYFYPGVYADTLHFDRIFANLLFLNTFYFPAINYLPPGSWSISVEMFFYLLSPLFFVWVSNLKKSIIYLIIILTVSISFHYLLFYIVSHHTSKDWNVVSNHSFYFWLPNQLPVFFIGFLLFWLKDYCENLTLKNKLMIGNLSFLAIILYFLASFIPFNNQKPFLFIRTELVYSIIFLILALGLSFTKSKIFINKYIIALGKVSFSVYITHFIFISVSMYFIKMFLPNIENLNLYLRLILGILYVLFIAFVSYNFSLITYKYIEQNGMKLGKYFINKNRSK